MESCYRPISWPMFRRSDGNTSISPENIWPNLSVGFRPSRKRPVMTLQASPETRLMRAEVQRHYPHIWQELEGLAQGLEATVDQVFAWNCRGDLVRSTSDGCTTVAGVNAAGERIIAHNEDGFPQLRDECLLATITPVAVWALRVFAYPGSICGQLCGKWKGIVNTVNNIRACIVRRDYRVRSLARASLNANTLDEAINILTGQPRSGAFHHTLRAAGRCAAVQRWGHRSRLFRSTPDDGNRACQPSGACGTWRWADRYRQFSVAAVTPRAVAGNATSVWRRGGKTILSDTHDAELPITGWLPTIGWGEHPRHGSFHPRCQPRQVANFRH